MKIFTLFAFAIALTFFVVKTYFSTLNRSPVVENKNFPEKTPKDPDKLYPQELFYLDRNYPDFSIKGNLYQERLSKAMHYDAKKIKTHRGLDHPWTVQGPGNIGGRINTIAVHPLNNQIIMLGFSQGGIYHSKDGGNHWRAVFENQPSLAISHIEIDVKSAGRVFATTGDVNISSYPFLGSGVFRSDNGGIEWTYKGLGDKGILSKVIVDPTDNNIIYVGSMGFPSQKGNEKGLYRSTDAGETWEKTLTIDDSTGVIDIVADPTKPGRLFATSWTRLRTSKYSTTVGPGTSVYRSEDYGQTWINLTTDLPASMHSRTGIEITNDGSLFVSYTGTPTTGECAGYGEAIRDIFISHDGGDSWDSLQLSTVIDFPCGALSGMGWYFESLKVNPQNPLDMFLLGVDLYRSMDGGQSWIEATPQWWTYEVHADKHDLKFAAGKMYLATDGGAYRTNIDGSEPWEDFENIPATQFYRTAYNPHLPDQYFGGAQDNGTTGGNKSFINEWPRIFGGDGFQPLFDPDEPDWIYALLQNGNIWFTSDGLEYNHLNDGLYGQRYWDMPFIMSKHDSKILFGASHVVFRMNMHDSIRRWDAISHDLTRGDSILGNRYPAITALAQSEIDEQRLYAGTQDGKVWTSPDGGEQWIDISDGTPGHYVTSITASQVDPLKVYVTYSGYRDNDHTPYIQVSFNAGESWDFVAEGFPLTGVNALQIHPAWNDEVLFAGTDGGVYVSLDGGNDWERLGTNFPYMPVYDLEYNPAENTIVAATFARGLMTFPLEELDLVSSVDPVSQNSDLSGIKIYPTIVDENIIIDFENYTGAQDVFMVSIVNVNGNQLYSEKIKIDGSNKIEIYPEKNFSNGVYFISVVNGMNGISRRIIIH